MRVSRRSLLSRVFDDGDLLEEWGRPDPAADMDASGEGLIANMSPQDAAQADGLARSESPWIEPGTASGSRKPRRSA